MGGPGGVRVQGLQETAAAFRATREDLGDLTDAMGKLADAAADVLRPLVPVRTRALVDSVRAEGTRDRAVVTAGNARVDYAAPVLRGRSKAITRTDAVMDDRAPEILEAGWTRIAERNGLL